MIKGKQIDLRHVDASELELLLRMNNDQEGKGEFGRTLLRSPAALKKDFELNGLSSDANETFAIVDKTNNIIGNIGHFTVAHYSTARELGFLISPAAQRKGVATEAVQLLTKYLFDNFPINRIQICMATAHVASERVAINNGYTKEGILKGFIFVKGQYLDVIIYAITRDEFNKL